MEYKKEAIAAHNEINEFLKDYDEKFIERFLHAIKRNFIKEVLADGTVREDLSPYAPVYNQLIELICNNLFDVSNEKGFPKANAFRELFMRGTGYTVGEIAIFFINNQLSEKSINKYT